VFFFFQAEDGIRDFHVTGVQTCALPIYNLVYHILFLFLDHNKFLNMDHKDLLLFPKNYLLYPCEQFALLIVLSLYSIFQMLHHRSEERRVGKEMIYRKSENIHNKHDTRK